MSTPSYDWIAHHAYNRPNQEAVVDLATDRSFTWEQFNDRTSRLASALAGEFGIERGDRVAVLANNNTNFFEVQFACWKLGAIFVPLNWRLAIPELEFIVGDCAPKAVVHDDQFADVAEKVAALTGVGARINWSPSVGEPTTGSGQVASYEDALAAVDPMEGAARCTHDDPVMVMYTSGTTGRPKGAIITQGMTFWNVINSTEFFQLGSSMTNLAFLPLFHTGGLNCFANPAFHYGGRNVVMKDFDPAYCLELITDPSQNITHFLGVPANYLFMSQVPAFETATFPTVQASGVGGSPTPIPLIETWLAKGLPLQQGFGMTETSPMVLALKPEDAATRIGAAGIPALHTEVKIVGEDGEEIEGPDETGELWVRGPNVTPGYWNRPEATAESITDGWLHTGDATRRDADGFYYVVDRWKDMYISGGENVYPAEVESVIYQLDGIVEVSVIGVPDERWVEAGRACVVLAEGADLAASTIINHCRENLARFKVPRDVVFIDEIPHNATGKVLKRELRDLYSD